jgi:ribose transport system ATP-binding protein
LAGELPQALGEVIDMPPVSVNPAADVDRSLATVSAVDTPELIITGLRKSFGPVEVLHGIDLRIRSGEFVGLMGPNGAGKSTLIKILDGVYGASAGEIRLGDQRVPTLGGRTDVAFIHQDLGLIDDMSVLDNLRLGESPLRVFGPILNRGAERQAALGALEHVGLTHVIDSTVGELTPGEKALVAIARAFGRGAKILFVDESTSTLPVPDAKAVIASLRKSAAAGATVVMVSHKLHEILEACGRVVVLLDGRLAADEQTAGMNRDALVKLLLQHETAKVGKTADQLHSHRRKPDAAPLIELRGVYGKRVGPIDLTVHHGEILGLTGLLGSGLHDIAFLLHGSMKPTKGTICKEGDARVALVPPNRETQGGFADLSVLENITISSLWRWVRTVALMNQRREKQDSEAIVGQLKVKPNRTDVEYGVLSGGNKQKVIFGRALLSKPQLYVLCEPTRGVDIQTRNEIYRLIEELRDGGAGIVVVSSDAEDLFAVCDEVAVVERGTLKQPRKLEDLTLADLETLI